MRRPDVWAILATLAAASTAHGADEAAPAYVIGPRDVVRVQAAWTGTPTKTGSLDVRVPVWLDGTIVLLQQGRVPVGGFTAVEAAQNVSKHLAAYYDSPPASISAKVEMVAYESQELHVLEHLPNRHMFIQRMPFTGAETVIDLVAAVDGLPARAMRCTLHLERPDADGMGPPLVMQVDWRAIVHQGDTATNYRLQADDRLVVRPAGKKPWVSFHWS